MIPVHEADEARQIVETWLEDARDMGQEEVRPSKRGDRRFLWNQTMELLIDQKVHYVQGRDVCERGVGLVCRVDFPIDGSVHLRRDEQDPWVRCRVAHVTPTIGAYRTGVELLFDF